MVCTVDVCVFNRLMAPETSTLALTPATSSCRCTTGSFPAITVTCCESDWNPAAETVTV